VTTLSKSVERNGAGPRAWHPEIGAEEYHRDEKHDSNSWLRVFEDSESRYYHRRVTKRIPPKPETEDQRTGTACHIALHQPELVDKLIDLIPPEVLSRNGSKSGGKWDEWKEAHPNTVHLKREDYDLLRWQIESVWGNPACRDVLAAATIREYPIFWTTDQGYSLKCLIDLGNELDAVITDTKTTRRRDRDFWRAVREYGYEAQGALYSDGFQALYGVQPSFQWMLISDEPPYDCCIRECPPELIRAGRDRNDNALERLYACKRGERPWTPEGYDEVRPLVVPPFMLTEEAPESIGARQEF
jgi:hypothetical protein